MLSATALILLVNTLSSILKRFILPKFGVVGIQVIVFILSMVGALYVTFKTSYPQLETFVTATIGIFTLSVTFYEVILQHIPWFKGKK